jgi:uncharacterized protein DUF2442
MHHAHRATLWRVSPTVFREGPYRFFFFSREEELFLAFRLFPWFTDATIAELSHIEVERGHVLRWPALDIDLDVSRIEYPERYPLVARGRSRPRRTRRTGAPRAVRA